MANKLYVEFRLHFDPRTNQDLLKQCADVFQDIIYEEWENSQDADTPIPSIHDVTYEIVMEAEEEKKDDS